MAETIAAISTPFGEGGIAVLRLSGPNACDVAGRVFRGRRPVAEQAPRVQHLGKLIDPASGGAVLDEVLLTVFRAPASYTGEELVEIACHGGILVTRRILSVLLNNGAQAAGPGEFTQRAFLNGKMDLTQAEAVMDLIRAQTDLGLRAATEQLEGRLGASVRALREALLEVLAHVEAHIDFPDEDISPETGAALSRRLESVRAQIAALLQTAGQGRVLREGLRTVIYGAPNVGKSSLLNRLLGYERAIVSEIPGTTRDTIEETINLRGIPVRLVDTAGVRHSADEIERKGIARTLRHLDRADLVLHVADSSQPPPEVPDALDATPAGSLLVLNKCDLGEHPAWAGRDAVRISCLEADSGPGLEPLLEAIFNRAMGSGFAGGSAAIAINARHQACLDQAAAEVDAALKALAEGVSPEFTAVDLRAALNAVGDIVGRADTEDLLGKIFSSFCLGK